MREVTRICVIYSIWWFVWRKPNQQPTQNVIFFLKLFWLKRTPTHSHPHTQPTTTLFCSFGSFFAQYTIVSKFISYFDHFFSSFWFHFNTRVNFFSGFVVWIVFFVVVVVEIAVLLTFHMGFFSIPAFDCSHTFNWITLLCLMCKFNRYVYYLCLIV